MKKEKFVTIYLFVMLLFPLFYRNDYFDILYSKRLFYLTVTGCFVMGMAVISIIWKESASKMRKESLYFAALLVIGFIFSFLINTNKVEMFFGREGRYLGILAMLFGILTFVWVSIYFQWNNLLTWCWTISTCIVYLLQILNWLGMDVLQMSVNLLEKGFFISTIGHINFNATYNMLTLPAFMVLFLISEQKLSRIVYATAVVLGMAGCIGCRSDSVFLGAGAVVLVLFGYVLLMKHKEREMLQLLELLWISMFLSGSFYYLLKDQAYILGDIPKALIDIKTLFILAVILLVMEMFRLRFYDKIKKKINLGKCYIIVILLGILCVGIAMVYVNISPQAAEEHRFLSRFYLDDNWGSQRGYIWKTTVHEFVKLPLVNKLFGIGMGNFGSYMNAIYGQEMVDFLGGYLIDAHSEYLQILFSLGIVGFAGYFGMISSVLYYGMKNIRTNPDALLAVAGIIVFLVQGMVNNPQIATTPLFFICLGIYQNLSTENITGK